jgi:hypothetical protein
MRKVGDMQIICCATAAGDDALSTFAIEGHL